MEEEKDKPNFKFSIEGFDPLGLKSLGEISKEAVEFGIDGAKEFLKLTCKPLLEEFGLLARDQFTNWRLLNIIKMLEKAKGKLQYDPEKEKLVIDPRVAYQIVDHASIVSNEILQEMWAGLFASSCHSYEEDENIIFIDILKRLTSSQVKLLDYLCKKPAKYTNVVNLAASKEAGIVLTGPIEIKYEELFSIMETDSRLKVDTEFNAIENLGLIAPGSNTVISPLLNHVNSSRQTHIKPTLITIRLYVKCQGSSDTPFNYFLPEIINFYYDMIKSSIQVKRESTLEYIYENAQYGQTFANEIEFGSSGFKLKNDTWLYLSEDELNKRLRPYLIYRFISGIDKVYPIEVNKKIIGRFSYKEGVVKN